MRLCWTESGLGSCGEDIELHVSRKGCVGSFPLPSYAQWNQTLQDTCIMLIYALACLEQWGHEDAGSCIVPRALTYWLLHSREAIRQ